MIRSFSLRAAIGAAIVSVSLVSAASAEFVIDDFEQGGPINLFADHTTSPAPEHTASGINVPGGMRRVTLDMPGEPDKEITCELQDTAGDDAITFFGKNPPNRGSFGALIDYGTTSIGTPWLEAVDLSLALSPHGDRFYLDCDIPEIGGQTQTGYRIQLYVQHSNVELDRISYSHTSQSDFFYPVDGRQEFLLDRKSVV